MARRGTVEFDATIRGGLPVYVIATIYPPEPDVGIFSEQVEIQEIFWPPRWSKKTHRRLALCPIPQKLFEDAIKFEQENLELQALEAAS